ncbi:MAG: thiamine pyrophosphate-binding protein [Aristaeellaceae bacterium]
MKLTGGQMIVKYLEKEQVPYVLGIPGHGILGFFDALKEEDQAGNIKYLQVQHEQTAVHMADGYFRVSGKPLASFTSVGPGALNTAIGLGTALVDSSAVLQICGDAHVNMKGVGVLQEVERFQDSNYIRALEPVTKRSWRVESPKQLPRLLQRAFNEMTTGRRGPVLLSMPMDVQSNAADVTLPEPDMHRAVNATAASAETIHAAVALMATAKRPVIVIGGGALRNGTDPEKLVRLAELWGAAVVTTMAGKSAFPENHPLYGFHSGSKGTPVGVELTRKADVVLALGTRFADEATCSYRKGAAYNFPETKLIQVDTDSREIGKNYGVDVPVLGDLRLVVDQLIEAYTDQVGVVDYREKAYTKEIARLNAAWAAKKAEKRAAKYEKVTISQLLGIMEETLPEDTIITTSSGNTQAQCLQEYVFKKPGTHLTTGGFSTMGWAFPAAMGAKLAKPDVPVVALMGDGDFMMVMQELATMKKYNIPVIVICANNACWMAIRDLQEGNYGAEHRFGNDFVDSEGKLYSPDFKAIAESFGVYAQKVSQPGEVAQAIRSALDAKTPAFIEVDVDREFPQSGGEAYGWWDVPVPETVEDLAEARRLYEEGLAEETV